MSKDEKIELYQKWVVKTKKNKPYGFSKSWINLMISEGLFDISFDEKNNYEEKIKQIKNSKKNDESLFDPKTIRVKVNAVISYKNFREYIEKNGVESLENVILKNDSQTKGKIDEYDLNEEQVPDMLLEQLRKMDPFSFEELLGDLFYKMGYGKVDITSKTNDKGIDGKIFRDELELDRIIFQAKRFSENNIIGRPIVQSLMGAVTEEGASYGILITTGTFHENAVNSAKSDKRIKLIDCYELIDLLLKYEVGVEVKSVKSLYEIDYNYFKGN
jgi:restriction system protein